MSDDYDMRKVKLKLGAGISLFFRKVHIFSGSILSKHCCHDLIPNPRISLWFGTVSYYKSIITWVPAQFYQGCRLSDPVFREKTMSKWGCIQSTLYMSLNLYCESDTQQIRTERKEMGLCWARMTGKYQISDRPHAWVVTIWCLR